MFEGPDSPTATRKVPRRCYKKYSNAGATGDSIGSGKNLSKVNTGRSPVISGIGINENKIIAGDNHKKWLLDAIPRQIKKRRQI